MPRLAATPSWLRPSDPAVRYITDQHGAIPGNAQVLDDLLAILGAYDIPRPVPDLVAGTDPDVRVPEQAVADRPVPVEVVIRHGPSVPLEAVLLYENREVIDRRPLLSRGSVLAAELTARRGGLHTARVASASPGSGPAVTAPLTIWPGGPGQPTGGRG